MQLIKTFEDLKQFDIFKTRPRVTPTGVLMCTPEYYDVVDVKNYFMDGNIGLVDRAMAQRQWHELKSTFERCGLRVETIQAQEGIEDMIFSANSALTWQESSKGKVAFMSRMFHSSRQRETPFYTTWLKEHGYEIIELPDREGVVFEGGGDAIWHPGKMLLWAGFGHRSTKEVYEWMSEELNMPIIMINLVSDEFYHLDTAFHPLDEVTVLYCPDAFDKDGIELIEAVYPRRVIISKDQGTEFFTGNCFCVNGKYVVMQKGDIAAVKKLQEFSYEPVEVDLSEYIKSGGNVTCLKMDLY